MERDRCRRPCRRTPRVVWLLTVYAITAGCGGDEPAGAQPGGPEGGGEAVIPAVEVVQAREGAVPLRERLTGTVRAAGQVIIYPQVSGLVTDVLAENGDRVDSGQTLVRIRSQSAETQLAQARASLDVARADLQQARANVQELEVQFERTRLLAEDQLVSAEALETQRAQLTAARASAARAEAAVAVAQAQMAEQEEALRQTVVRSPIRGRVGQRSVEVGMRVDGQTPLFTVGQLDDVRVEVPVTQDILSGLQVGQRVELQAESLGGRVIEAEISRISPFLDAGSYSAEVEIDVPNADGLLTPGMFVTADLFYGTSESSTLVPTSALYEHPDTGERGLYLLPGGVEELPPRVTAAEGEPELTAPQPLHFQPVEVLAQGHQVVGIAGVEPGAWVVVVGQHLLSGLAADTQPRARLRPITWDEVERMQRLQREDLLIEFMEKQQRLAREVETPDPAGRTGRTSL